MPHSSHTGELVYDLEMEKKVCRLRKETKKRKEEQSSTASLGLDLAMELLEPSSDSEQEKVMNGKQ